jgi:hypothetical protein
LIHQEDKFHYYREKGFTNYWSDDAMPQAAVSGVLHAFECASPWSKFERGVAACIFAPASSYRVAFVETPVSK